MKLSHLLYVEESHWKQTRIPRNGPVDHITKINLLFCIWIALIHPADLFIESYSKNILGFNIFSYKMSKTTLKEPRQSLEACKETKKQYNFFWCCDNFYNYGLKNTSQKNIENKYDTKIKIKKINTKTILTTLKFKN